MSHGQSHKRRRLESVEGDAENGGESASGRQGHRIGVDQMVHDGGFLEDSTGMEQFQENSNTVNNGESGGGDVGGGVGRGSPGAPDSSNGPGEIGDRGEVYIGISSCVY
jgi:hypothetical protein